MRRPRVAILLILAFVATLSAPVRAGWSCPDGTPCVAHRGLGFVCASDRCATRKSCCEVERPVRCKHGALPGLEGTSGPGVQVPDHCRFSVTVQPHLVAVTERSAPLLWMAVDLLPAPDTFELTVPIAAPVWRAEHSPGCRPPPLLPSGPSRAPPVA